MTTVLAATLLVACQGVPDDKLVDFSDDGTGAAEEDDGFTLPPAPICDPIRQDCDPDQKCTALKSGDVQDRFNCVDDDGFLGAGQACMPAPTSGQDQCDAGLVCVSGGFDVPDGVCLEMCNDDLQCDAGRCIDDAGTGVRHCAPKCEPFAKFCPNIRHACLPTDDGYACRYPGENDQAGPLEGCDPLFGIGCAEGLACMQGGVLIGCKSPSCCTPICNLDEPETCATGTTCNDLGTDPPNVGVCTVPQ